MTLALTENHNQYFITAKNSAIATGYPSNINISFSTATICLESGNTAIHFAVKVGII
jgi:hypothetical protein